MALKPAFRTPWTAVSRRGVLVTPNRRIPALEAAAAPAPAPDPAPEPAPEPEE